MVISLVHGERQIINFVDHRVGELLVSVKVSLWDAERARILELFGSAVRLGRSISVVRVRWFYVVLQVLL